MKPNPRECPHCAYDRRFPGFEAGGWLQQDNNGPIVSCPMCNDDGAHPFDPIGDGLTELKGRLNDEGRSAAEAKQSSHTKPRW